MGKRLPDIIPQPKKWSKMALSEGKRANPRAQDKNVTLLLEGKGKRTQQKLVSSLPDPRRCFSYSSKLHSIHLPVASLSNSKQTIGLQLYRR
jgi:hypothetical protein